MPERAVPERAEPPTAGCALPGENDGGVAPARGGVGCRDDEGDDVRRGAPGAAARCVRASAAGESGVRWPAGRAGLPGARASSRPTATASRAAGRDAPPPGVKLGGVPGSSRAMLSTCRCRRRA
ncbi:hypothetical protein GCM10009774_13450 [Cellulomonas gelida]|uniref:Uncharacterized protein n=1 Tax=Cellulomonas gelida TaxID=1712 RepID=A0A4Y3KI00_9CELL|nr:hypothetical protein CGE01nite_07740 [Cellulomonas gelida]GGL24277.1 hypothetical protein GCM10009774_13450 [Cellulomonas gelida]